MHRLPRGAGTCSLATPCSRRDWMISRTRSGCRIRTVAFSSSGTCRQRPRSVPPRGPPSSGGTETLQPPLSLCPGRVPPPSPGSPARSPAHHLVRCAPLRSARTGPRSRGEERARGRDRNAAAGPGGTGGERSGGVRGLLGPGNPPALRPAPDRQRRLRVPRDEPGRRKRY